MKRKTLSIDLDVYRELKRRQAEPESLSATLRRILEEEKDPADYLDELAAHPPVVDLALLRRRQAKPIRSARPASRKRHAA